MKILVVVSEFPKLTETFVYRNVAEYQRLGHETWLFHIRRFRHAEVTHGFMQGVLACAFSYRYLGLAPIAAVLRETVTAPRRTARLVAEILRAHRHEPKRGLAVLSYLPKSLALGHWCRRQGIEHIHAEFAGHPATAAMIAARISGVPFSFSAHANDFIVSQALLNQKAQEAQFVRTISKHNVSILGDMPGFPGEKLELIRCGVARETLDAPVPTPPDATGLRILYVGSLLKKKGVRHLIDALALLPDDLVWRCRILGGGDLAEDLEAQAATLGITDRVQFDGPRAAEEVAAAFRDAHIVVVPSVLGEKGRVEGIPVVLMEALAHARPVIASEIAGIPELIEDGETGHLVPPGDAEAIAGAIREIATDWTGATEMGLRGRERIRAHYVVEDNAAVLARRMAEEA